MTARRLAATLAATAISVVLLTGCVSSGTVTDKSYREPYTTCAGRPIVCTKHEECWRLHLRSNRGDLGEQCVTKEAWDVHPVGSYYEGGGT